MPKDSLGLFLRRVDRTDVDADIAIAAFIVVNREHPDVAYYDGVERTLDVAGAAADTDFLVYIMFHQYYLINIQARTIYK